VASPLWPVVPGFRGVYHRAGPPGPASGRPDGRLRPDPVAQSGLPVLPQICLRY